MNKIKFKDLNIVHICNPRLKHSYVSVDKDTTITLKTSRVSSKYIDEMLRDKEPWIRKQLLKLEQYPQIKPNLEDEILLFGEIYSIDSIEATSLRDMLHKVRVPSERNILKCYDNYYKIVAKEYLLQRVLYYADIMNLNYTELRYKKMKSRWESCSSKKIITLNTHLLKLKKEYIDYVIVHELAHLVHMNHSKEFHSLVQNYMQNAKELRKELKYNYIF